MSKGRLQFHDLPFRYQDQIAAQLGNTTRNKIEADSSLSNPKPQQDKANALDSPIPGKTTSIRRIRVCFVSYRTRPLDPDNAAAGAKDLLDGLRHAGLLPDDNPEQIRFETEQVKVKHLTEERTEIILEYP